MCEYPKDQKKILTPEKTVSLVEEEAFLEIDNIEGCNVEMDDEATVNDRTADEDDDDGDSGSCSIVGLAAEPKKSNSLTDKSDNGDDADDDDNDNDDDSVIVTIDSERLRENARLTRLLRADQLASLNVSLAMDAERDRVHRYIETDLELQREIEMIVRESIRPTTDKCISVSLNNQVVLVPVTIRISDRLASYIWGAPRQYRSQSFPFVEEFDRLLDGLSRTSEKRRLFAGIMPSDGVTLPRTFAVFAVRYVRTNCLTSRQTPQHQQQHRWATQSRDIENIALPSGHQQGHHGDNGNQPSSSSWNKKPMTNTIFGLYQYCDFSVMIIRDNRVVDYAVHGVHSNIAETITRHKPEVVYYNAQPDDALDVFVRYEWQPFYECLRDIARPVSIYRNNRELFNTLPFCTRCDTFCAFCHALRDIRSLIARPWQISRSVTANLETTQIENRRQERSNLAHRDTMCDEPSSRPFKRQRSRYEPYHKTCRGADWRHQARSRRPRRMQSNKFNYNANCEQFRL